MLRGMFNNDFVLQEVKKAVIADMTKLGKEAGLKSFEQVTGEGICTLM